MIAALIVVLCVALYFVVVQIKHVQAAMAADNAAHAPTQQASTAAASSSDARIIVDSFVRPSFTNDPFQTPPMKSTTVVPPTRSAVTHMPTLPSTSPIMRPLTVRPLPSTVTPVQMTTVATPVAAPEGIDVKTLHVTAIMKGPRSTALIERDGHDPVTVAVGGHIAGYTISAIKDDGVILSGDSGIYTLSLASAPSSQDADQDTQTPTVAANPALTVGQETANVAH